MLWHLYGCFFGGVYVYILDVRNRGPPCLFKSVLPVSLIWQRDGCLNQRSFCFYVEMWALTSTRLCCLCFSPHLAPSPVFPHYFFPSISILFAVLSIHSEFLPHAVLLTDSPLLSCHLHSFSCLCLLIIAFFSFPYSLLSLLPLIHCFPRFSVPASRSGPLGPAEAAQGQLFSGGNKAG